MRTFIQAVLFCMLYTQFTLAPVQANITTVECLVGWVYALQEGGVEHKSLECDALDYSAGYVLEDVPSKFLERF